MNNEITSSDFIDCLDQLQRDLDTFRTKYTATNNPLIPEMVQLPDRAYAVGKYPITFEEYDYFAESTKRELPDDNGWGRGKHPVINVSWYDAQNYCAWLSTKTSQHYRLPTEDEFEHFCNDHQVANSAIAVFAANQTALVGTKLPNKYGLHDCLGNVWEWQDNLYELEQPYRVVRGGSWDLVQRCARCAFRDRNPPVNFDYNLGFRVVLSS